jgi:hypothetical protein
MGKTLARGRVVSKIILSISAKTRVPMAKYIPLNLKVGNPIMIAKSAAANAPARRAKGRGSPDSQRYRAIRAPKPKKAAWPRLFCPAYPPMMFQLCDKIIYWKVKHNQVKISSRMFIRGISTKTASMLVPIESCFKSLDNYASLRFPK